MFDEKKAARALEYFRRCRDEGVSLQEQEDGSEEERAALVFVRDIGQSIDWILDGNVAGMICGLGDQVLPRDLSRTRSRAPPVPCAFLV